MKARATSSARCDGEGVRDGLRARERGRGLVGVRLDRRGAQPLDIVEEPGRSALAQDAAEQRAEHAHVGPHALGDLLAGLESSDEVDRLGLGELTHEIEAIAGLFRGRIVADRVTSGVSRVDIDERCP